MQCDDYLPDQVRISADGVESAQELVRLLRSARRFVFFSSFLCDLTQPLPGDRDGITLQELFWELSTRDVALYVLYNDEPAYGNLPLAQFTRKLPETARVRVVSGSGRLPAVARLFCANTRFTNHHQKYVCVDGVQMMIGGTDVDAQRTGWLQSNGSRPDGYCWHETSVTFPCTSPMLEFVRQNFDVIATDVPFPLVHGGAREHAVLLHLIDNAQSCIHMEAQTCISSGTTANTIFSAVARRVARAFANPDTDRFHFLFLTNEFQIDESAVVSWATTQHLAWSTRHLNAELHAHGVSPPFITARVFLGFMEAPGKKHIKIHSNMTIQDGHTLLRSSSNFTDRSLSPLPCDNELGVLLHGQVVAHFQQKIWRRYFGLSARVLVTPEDAVRMMRTETGVIRHLQHVVFDPDAAAAAATPPAVTATPIPATAAPPRGRTPPASASVFARIRAATAAAAAPDATRGGAAPVGVFRGVSHAVFDVAMDLFHTSRVFGGKEKIEWEVSR
jgi:phosphatidylserine/phosphatidylglycerophosphate/cardiolipin synthase-like enzyme